MMHETLHADEVITMVLLFHQFPCYQSVVKITTLVFHYKVVNGLVVNATSEVVTFTTSFLQCYYLIYFSSVTHILCW